MNNKVKNIVPDHMTCDRYITRIIRQEKALRKPGNTPHFQDKISIVPKATSPIQTRIKSLKSRQASPIKSNNITTILQPPSASPQLSVDVDRDLNKFVKPRQRHRSVSSCSSHRESWGQLLQTNKSRENASSFSNFDPLRTLHFLSKELHFKLQTVLPEEVAVQQIVYDIQHALKRIPPEVASLIHLQSGSLKSLDEEEKCISVLKPTVLNKCCQTPPTLYQEDSEGFHRMMEENTHKLAVSCKQLELVCTNLQQEKEITEKELENSRQNIASLKKRVKELEAQTEPSSAAKRVRELEADNRSLQEKLDKLMEELNNSSTSNLRKLVDELRSEKSASDQNRAKLEYDITLLSLEKEKFVTMLAVRDREIKEIQEEMSRIQEQVSAELKKLHTDVISRVASVKSLTDNTSASTEENRIGIGDATISSIRADDTNGRDFPKESPWGDGEMGTAKTDNFVERLTAQIKAINTKFDIPPSADQHTSLQELLKEMGSTNPFLGNKNP